MGMRMNKKVMSEVYDLLISLINKNQFSELYCEDNPLVCNMILSMYYWKMTPVDKHILRYCLTTEDYYFDKIFKFVADKWEKEAKKEIAKEIKKIEKCSS